MSKGKKEFEQFVSEHRDVRISGFGHHILLAKGVPTHVPALLHGAALNVGAQPVNKNFKLKVDEEPPKTKVEQDPDKRWNDIKKAVRIMIAQNKGEQWTASGKPKIAVVTKLVGYRVYEAETQSVWDELRPEAGNIAEAGLG
jgi:hypothetical protein